MITEMLVRAFRVVGKAIAEKPKHPILGCAHLVCDGSTLVIRSTNLSNWKVAEMPGDGSQFEAVVPFHTLKKLVRAIATTAKEISLKLENDCFMIIGDTFRYTLPTYPVDQFPIGHFSLCESGDIVRIDPALKSPRSKGKQNKPTNTLPVDRPRPTASQSGDPAINDRVINTPDRENVGSVEEHPQYSENMEYSIDIEQIKQAVAVSLRPDQAYELACGISKVILIQNPDEEIDQLFGKYCLIHAAQVTGRDELESLDGFKSLQISPDFAPPGSILGYCVLDSIKKYTAKDWVNDRNLGRHDIREDLDVFKKLSGISGDLYGVMVRNQVMLAEPVFNVGGEIQFFWSPTDPADAAAFRAVFEADRPALDVSKEELEMGLNS